MNKTYTELQKEEADEYQELFNFFALNHDLSLTTGEMDDIIHAVKYHLKQRLETRPHETIVIGEGDLDYAITKLKNHLGGIRDDYREAVSAKYSSWVNSVRKAIKILEER